MYLLYTLNCNWWNVIILFWEIHHGVYHSIQHKQQQTSFICDIFHIILWNMELVWNCSILTPGDGTIWSICREETSIHWHYYDILLSEEIFCDCYKFVSKFYYAYIRPYMFLVTRWIIVFVRYSAHFLTGYTFNLFSNSYDEKKLSFFPNKFPYTLTYTLSSIISFWILISLLQIS